MVVVCGKCNTRNLWSGRPHFFSNFRKQLAITRLLLSIIIVPTSSSDVFGVYILTFVNGMYIRKKMKVQQEIGNENQS